MSYWTDEKVMAASQMWNDTRMSAAKIAAKLGCARNAVIGIAHRRRDLFPSRVDGGDYKQVVEPWSKEDLETAARLWGQGRNDREIAEIMGIKRDRVIMGRRPRPDMFPPRERTAAVVPKDQAPRLQSARMADFGLGGVSSNKTGDGGRRYRHAGQAFDPDAVTSFVALSSHQCSWPLTDFDDADGPDMPCCGRQRRGSRLYGWTSSYCAGHAAIARGERSVGRQRHG